MGGWQQIAALPNPRAAAASCYLGDKVYLFGGTSSPGGWTSTTYIYDPDTNTWSSAAAIPGAPLAHPKAFTMPDGTVAVFGTSSPVAAYRYNPADNTWASMSTTGGLLDRAGGAVAFQDAAGRIYLAGATPNTPNAQKLTRYTPGTDTWTALADVPTLSPRRAWQIGSVGVLGDNGVAYSGGQSSVDTLLAYDTVTGVWSVTAPQPSAPGSPQYNLAVSRLPNGLIVTMPGFGSDLSGLVKIRRIDGFDPATGTWSIGVLPNFPANPMTYPAITTDPDGRIWVMGGRNDFVDGGPSSATAYVYLQNRPPTAPTLLTLTGGVIVSTAATNRARHAFNDPDAGDSQSKFDWRHRLVGAGTWITGTELSPNPWYDIPAGELVPGGYERQVLAYDAGGLPAPAWTPSGFFTAGDPPAGPVITYPINGQTFEQLERVDWSVVAQDAYQVRRVADDGAGSPVVDPVGDDVYFDTGEVAAPLTRTVPLIFETNNRDEHVQVRVKKDGLWSDLVDVGGEVSYTRPPVPTYELYTDPSTASLLLMITNPTPTGDEPAAAYNDVYIDDGAGEERKATALPTNTSWRHWTPVSGRDYSTSVRVVAVAANGTTASSGT
ncbi:MULTISPECIES: Kelch repeat-containing protein [unclassified Nocardioides]|uniref:Kelch repeat-containing protein n=1 Tax=unclassified Nocardioides TaxID=2615069 RepID=UPI0009F08303|nr:MULTISPECIES: kelch repeat-containing protein [unclassified Nocardioides]GAW50623.1 hypothetical protein PD653B2_2959 [Nocardioides sp. PD653-B2]GAW55522.1 hypothetical protein PD653_2947 [Nocardioides sp. PD653]